MEELGIRGELRSREPLYAHTYLHVGGEAEYFLFAREFNDIKKSLDFCKEKGMPYYIIGNGSNVLFLDEGFSGLVITTQRMDQVQIKGTTVRSEAGSSLSRVIDCCKEAGLSGLESLIGIPGTIGGSVVMNAGAYGTEIGEFVSSVSVLRGGKILQLEEFYFNYRISSLKGEILLDIALVLRENNKREIEERMTNVAKERKVKMPGIPKWIGTCGSVFKNPEGNHAGSLIERAGLKGKRVGGASVSTHHANYIFTEPSATSRDVINLIRKIIDEVDNKFGITLETEVLIVGKEDEIQI